MKTRYIFFLAAMGLLASCTKEADAPQMNEDIPSGAKTYLTVKLDTTTKTYLGDKDDDNKHKVYWSNDDQIKVDEFDSDALESLEGDNPSATFIINGVLSDDQHNVLYPLSAWEDATHISLPAVQTWKDGNIADGMLPLAGQSNDGNITLHHLCAIVKVQVKRATTDPDTDDLVSVRFKGRNGEQVSGLFNIDYAGTPPTNMPYISSASDAVIDKEVKIAHTYTTSSTAVVYYLVVPAGTYDNGFDIIVKDVSGHIMTKNKTGSVELEAGHLYAMAAFEFVPTKTEVDVEVSSAQDLIAFATAYNTTSTYDDPVIPIVTLTGNIDFSGKSGDFNGTGGIGTSLKKFHGEFHGGGNTISNLAASVPLFAYVGPNGVVENVEIASTCSFTHSAAVVADSPLYLGSIAGYSQGTISKCVNRAAVSCTSSSYGDNLYIGGIVGLQEKYAPINYCENTADVTCSAKSGSPNYVYMGGIAGSLICEVSSDKAIISHCINRGNISRGTLDAASCNSVHEVGGVIGWLKASNDYKHTHSYLSNYGNVSGPNYQTATNKIAQSVGGVIGGIHSSNDMSGKVRVVIDHCSSDGCQVQNLFRNNGTQSNVTGAANYNLQCHNGGLIGIARGSGDLNSIELTNNTVNDVVVFSTRGFAGGLCGYSRGATISNCNVIASQVSGAQVFRAGGITGCGYDVIIDNCTAKLSKTSTLSTQSQTSSLFSAAVFEVGGIAGWVTSTSPAVTSQIKNCKVFIYHMRQSTVTNGTRGWIAGKCDGNATTIQNCRMGGTYYDGSSELIVIDDDSDIENDYIRGSSSTDVTISGSNTYWDGTL